MKLNYDCIRDLLLCLEENLELSENVIRNEIECKYVTLNTVCSLMPDYSKSDIVYTALKLNEAEFITAEIDDNNSSVHAIRFESITYNGHQYLDSIRNSKIWEEVKNTFKTKAIEFSIGAIFSFAQYAIKKQLIM